MKKIICWLRTIKYTFERFVKTGEILPYVSGHCYKLTVEQSDGTGKIEQTLECGVCGHISTAWK